jgi:hypothetical protein
LSKLQEIKDRLKETVEMYKKLQILRNNVFAHLGTIDTEEAFKLAGITPNDLRKLIESSNCILQEISYAYNNTRFALSHDSKEDTYSLLNDLLKMHN